MRVLALDPGPVLTGVVEFDGQSVRRSGVFSNSAILAHLRRHQPPDTQLAIEMIASYGMPVGREVFETCVWIGRFQQAWPDPEAVRRIERQKVKLHLCNSPRAKDANVWQALVDRFGPVGTKKEPGPLYGVRSHARAALALAVTAWDTRGQ